MKVGLIFLKGILFMWIERLRRDRRDTHVAAVTLINTLYTRVLFSVFLLYSL